MSEAGGAAEPQVVWRDQGKLVQRTLAPWWLVQVVLPVTWFIMLMNGGPGESVQCRDDPGACADGSALASLLAGTMFAIPFLLWMAPRAGLALGGLWGVAFLLASDSDWLLGPYGLVCLVVLGVMQYDRSQRRAAAPQPVPAAAVSGPRAHLRLPPAFVLVPAAVLVALLIFAVSFAGLYTWATNTRDAWVERSVVAEAQVTNIDDLGDVTFESSSGQTWSIDPEDTYQVGDTAQVRYDPDDPENAELDVEPARLDGLLTPAGWLLTLAAALVWRMAGLFRFRSRLRAGGLPEYSVLVGLRSRYLYLHGHPQPGQGQLMGRPFAMLPTRNASSLAAPPAVAPVYGEPEQHPQHLAQLQPLTPAVFVGTPLPGRWGVVIADGKVRWGRKPLGEVRRAPWNRSDQPVNSLSQGNWGLPKPPVVPR
ncbi:DUF3592 domain-containing protein [Kineosporia babensis]|uniref:DUF3592 domain-containing protein n=1 Tax=Kineosporia babensis TaxID=499548 RepID=A0A9X1NGZ9_9ACTN|nr:DUF3592 domain-containing protein [Kineosporia babensis]MCD5313116.1 DUF3592 domain-containing protein [Kineosporia babensis]